MADTTLDPRLQTGPRPAAAEAGDRPDTCRGPAPRRRRGPVLIGDILSAPGGRPLLLMHWDAPDDTR